MFASLVSFISSHHLSLERLSNPAIPTLAAGEFYRAKYQFLF